jgi:hypothetical protein
VYEETDAKVAHKVFEYRTELVWLAKRVIWQGYSKHTLETLISDADSGEESDFLRFLMPDLVPLRLRRMVSKPSVAVVSQLVWLEHLAGLVGFGYLYVS